MMLTGSPGCTDSSAAASSDSRAIGSRSPAAATAHAGADLTVSIAQFGSTRSINAGVAAGIAMHAWIRDWSDISSAW